MSDEEFEIFSEHYRKSQNIVEYGAGGSTYFGISNSNALITSVESDAQWLAKMQELPEIADAERAGRLSFIYVNIGATKRWGFPIDESERENWPRYAAAPWNPKTLAADLVFVDGRFRVACILTSILKIAPGTRIMVHDFWNRESYHVALPFLEKIESGGTLGVFRTPPTIDEAAISSLLREFSFVVN